MSVRHLRLAAWALCAGLALLALSGSAHAAGAAPQQQKLAVLEFAVDLVDKSQVDRLYFASAVQGAVQRLLPAQGYFIMTRENLQEILRGQGKSLEECQGNCEVETGRLLSADLVIAGRLSRVGARLKLALTLYQVASGQLLGTTIASGDTPEKLDDDIPAKVQELVAALLPLDGGAQSRPQIAPRPKQQAIVFVTSQPDGAQVKLDGQLLGPTPLSLPLKPGRYSLEASAPGYLPQTRDLQVVLSEEPSKVQFVLVRQEGKLSVSSNAACKGTAGERDFAVEAGNIVLLKLPTGPVQIRCTASDGRVATASAVVTEGEFTTAKLRFDAPAPAQVQRPPEPSSDGSDSSFGKGLDRRLQSGLTWGLTVGVGAMAAAGTGTGFGLSIDLQLRLAETLIAEAGFQSFNANSEHTGVRVGALVQPFALGPFTPYAGARFISDTGDLADGYAAFAGLGLEIGMVFAFEVQQGLTGGMKDATSYMLVMRPPEGFKF
jgi:hypothetical protein